MVGQEISDEILFKKNVFGFKVNVRSIIFTLMENIL